MEWNPEYKRDLLTRFAHHSSAIEGNGLSQTDVNSILLYQTLPEKMIPIREFLEVENHRLAFEFMFNNLEKDQPISIALINGIHEKLMDRIHQEKGHFKTQDNGILEANFKTVPATRVSLKMKQWVENLIFEEQIAKSDDDIIRLALENHIHFERIHLFMDGNGRTGRMLMMYFLMKHHIAPLIIKKDERTEYIRILDNQDVEGFFTLALPKIKYEEDRAKRFSN
ncbi:Fic family protein [Sporolactobacillus shoreae]|uniref:Fic family protein n=1 Tax=Sporolactobacillus shoreae TaxID=1465501 RepID=A0A4Z0GPF5_9BACL|nr:Fic family protein [Sporolactobacillus shoreae]TGA99012.1 Fic family protein [Sporolactobacillus shoreae]